MADEAIEVNSTEDRTTEPAPEATTSEQVPVVEDGEKGKPDARKVDDLPAWAQAELRRARNDAVKYRTQLQQQTEQQAPAGPSPEEIAEQAKAELAQQIGKALGFVQEEEKPVDPKTVIDTLTSERDNTAKERDAERELHRRTQVELGVHRTSLKLAADGDALLDSRSFLRSIKDLDPNAADFGTSLEERIQQAIEDNPKFKAASLVGPPARSGGEFTGGPGGRSGDSETKSVDDFRKARRASKSNTKE
ncbi:hypothetical protein [Streptosporangium lutulentum]|uniref:Scaffolding protein n=1 Tax=Streptosporangium lutulentum TaxID=1461250 RepID=A0ABT9QA35_9ACTN|nr:hypothetical protein [Streptosporangium lutulentum]MDP9843260.1 hypothetical protein [Streptosporangium lutulentum]